MIPVSTLAREGLLPVTMGMVLCNDDNLDPFVNMVQGLHAEGVVSRGLRNCCQMLTIRQAFHLPLAGSRLPIVFLPAKFDPSDPLQRLGIAYMTKGGISPLAQTGVKDAEASGTANGDQAQEEEESTTPERKRRRKSSSSLPKARPAPPPNKPTARRRSAPVRPNKLAPASS